MTKEQWKEYSAIYKAVWDLYRDPNKFRNMAEWRRKEGEIYRRIEALDVGVGDGCVAGRWVQWYVADGFANYLIYKVGKRDVQLDFLSLGDAYAFNGVYRNQRGQLVAPFPVVELQLRQMKVWREPARV